MKCSEWLREYQITGKVPEEQNDGKMLPFWCGWLVGTASKNSEVGRSVEDSLDMAIKAAEFIEAQR